MNPELLKTLLAKIKIPLFENKMLNLLLAKIEKFHLYATGNNVKIKSC